MKIKRDNLLIIACFVWILSGINILHIGLVVYTDYFNVTNFILSMIVFMVFQKFIFKKLVKKHTFRIISYIDDKQFFWKFFDKKSFIIMFFMVIMGVGIRKFNILPNIFIAIFYTGLGISLCLAGFLFGFNYIKLFINKEKKYEKLY